MTEEETVDSVLQSRAPRIIVFIVAFVLKFQMTFRISDNAVVVLLQFLKYLVLIIGRSFNVAPLQDIYFPQSLYGC